MQEQKSENCQDSSKENYKCLVSQTVYWHKDNQIDQFNRVTDPFTTQSQIHSYMETWQTVP